MHATCTATRHKLTKGKKLTGRAKSPRACLQLAESLIGQGAVGKELDHGGGFHAELAKSDSSKTSLRVMNRGSCQYLMACTRKKLIMEDQDSVMEGIRVG